MSNKYLGFYQNNYSYLVEKGFKILFISADTGAQVLKKPLHNFHEAILLNPSELLNFFTSVYFKKSQHRYPV
jgi:hypothetical protein